MPDSPEETTLYVLTRAIPDNDYDGVAYMYVTISETGLKNVEKAVRGFARYAASSKAFLAKLRNPDGISCEPIGSIDTDKIGGILAAEIEPVDDGMDDGVLLGGPLPGWILDIETDARMYGPELGVNDVAGFYLKIPYKDDRGGVECAWLPLHWLKAEMKKAKKAFGELAKRKEK